MLETSVTEINEDYGDGDDDDDHSDGASELLAVDPLSAGALRHHLRPLRRPWCP